MVVHSATFELSPVIPPSERRAAVRGLILWLGGGSFCVFMLLLVAAISADSSRADTFRFVGFVQFKLSGLGQITGATGSLSTTTSEKEIQMRLSNVSVGGADKTQELVTRVDRSNLVLRSSIIYDVVKGVAIRTMQRKTDKSMLDNKETDIFEYTELKDGRATRTEPYVEYKVADFLSVMLIAADAIHRKETRPIDLSMLRDRSVTRVTLTIGGEETVGGRPGTMVRVAPPDNPTGGIGYVIGRTNDGSYFPARISVATDRGLVELEGQPQ